MTQKRSYELDTYFVGTLDIIPWMILAGSRLKGNAIRKKSVSTVPQAHNQRGRESHHVKRMAAFAENCGMY
jgi:hypothetical protein